jgi:hypothetical protein
MATFSGKYELRSKGVGYVNKYTNPRKAEATTPEYINL